MFSQIRQRAQSTRFWKQIRRFSANRRGNVAIITAIACLPMIAGVGCVIHCEGGYVVVPSYTEVTAYDKDGKELKSWKSSESHFENFLKAVKSRNPKDLNAEVLEGHLSAAICHRNWTS